MTRWSWLIRCQSCGAGIPYIAGMTRAAATDPADNLICPHCGGTAFNDPRPGRKVPDSVWWNPWTWGATRWEWRDDCAGTLPTDDATTTRPA